MAYAETPYTELDAGTDGSVGTNGKYVLFGEWPQTVMAEGVTINEEEVRQSGAFTYYLGSDGEWYVKQQEIPLEDFYKYSDGSEVRFSTNRESFFRYFKVEPIKWRVLTTDYNGTGRKLLLAENILVSSRFYDSDRLRKTNGVKVYPSNYKESAIRAFLNGLEYKVPRDFSVTGKEFIGKGFLQTAFTESIRDQITTTLVDNSKANTFSHGWPCICDDTADKVFLLSYAELRNIKYGFAECEIDSRINSEQDDEEVSEFVESDNAKIRTITDFAIAAGMQVDNCQRNCMGIPPAGRWLLRSPYDDEGRTVHDVSAIGGLVDEGYFNTAVVWNDYGVVPALCMDNK